MGGVCVSQQGRGVGPGGERRDRADALEVRESERVEWCDNGEENEDIPWMTMEEFTREGEVRRSREEKHRLTVNYRLDRRTESIETKPSTRRMQRYPWISPTTHGLKVIARGSSCWVGTALNFGEQFQELWIESGETVLIFGKGSAIPALCILIWFGQNQIWVKFKF
jgi:hypothetical protein